jgi:hypothetical protein
LTQVAGIDDEVSLESHPRLRVETYANTGNGHHLKVIRTVTDGNRA